MNATATPAPSVLNVTGWTVTRLQGRYRVVDSGGAIRSTHASKAAAQAKLDKLTEVMEAAAAEAEPVIVKAGEAAPLTQHEAPREEPWGIPPVPPMVVTKESPADQREEAASVLAEAVAAGTVSFDAAASALLSGVALAQAAAIVAPEPVTPAQVQASPVLAALSEEAREQIARNAAEVAAHVPAKAPKAAKAEGEKLASVWVGWQIAELVMASSAEELSTIGAKLAAKTPNSLRERTIRLTAAEVEALSAAATAIENDAATTGDAKAAGRLAHSARTLRGRLANLSA